MSEQEPSEQDWKNAAFRIFLDYSIVTEPGSPELFQPGAKQVCAFNKFIVSPQQALAEMRKRTEITVSDAEVEAAVEAGKFHWRSARDDGETIYVRERNNAKAMILAAKRAESEAS